MKRVNTRCVNKVMRLVA